MRVIDSHTGGEPTRVIVDGGPPLGDGPLAERVEIFRERFDDVRRAVVLEPRGSDAVVGALLCPPTDPDCDTGVIFFNNRDYLGMCGHGSIGVAATLAYLGRAQPGELAFETPVGTVAVTLKTAFEATVENVPSYRYRRDAAVVVDGLGTLRGDVAWGGNWFFLVRESPLPITLANAPQLGDAARRIMAALAAQGITGADGAPVDHIELFGPPSSEGAHSRNFVLCPGGAYDRSPCGTGTSAKVACLAADGALAPGQDWIQESVIGSRFAVRYRTNDAGQIIASITGQAYVCADATLIRHAEDPFRNGIA